MITSVQSNTYTTPAFGKLTLGVDKQNQRIFSKISIQKSIIKTKEKYLAKEALLK